MDNHKQAIILIHGIWMKGFELIYLGHQLSRAGYRVYYFRYPSIFKSPAENAVKLEKFIASIHEPIIHFVAHSLGGVVLTHLFKNDLFGRAGKVVTIGTPVQGSVLARHIARNRLLKLLLGRSGLALPEKDFPGWKHPHPPLCVIAGTRKLGIGILLGPSVLTSQSDGTVNLEETQVESATQTHVFKQSHFSMLWSKQVASMIVEFLKN